MVFSARAQKPRGGRLISWAHLGVRCLGLLGGSNLHDLLLELLESLLLELRLLDVAVSLRRLRRSVRYERNEIR